MTDGEMVAAIWTQADAVVLATGIYMERHRIGWWSARIALSNDAALGGVDVAVLAEQVVRRLDERRA